MALKFTKDNPRQPECCVPGCTNGADFTTKAFNKKWRFSNAFNFFFGDGGYVCKTHHNERIAKVLHGLERIEDLQKYRAMAEEEKVRYTQTLAAFFV